MPGSALGPALADQERRSFLLFPLLMLLLLLLCGDIEANPGPPRRRPEAAAKGPSTEEKIDSLSRYD